MIDFNEKILIKKSQSGDKSSYGKLVLKYEQRLYSLTVGLTGGDKAKASDILQNGLIEAFKYIRTYRGDASFFSWVWRIVKREAGHFCKNKKTESYLFLEETQSGEIEDDLSVENEIVKKEKQRNLNKLISELPEKFQEVLVLIDFQGMKYDEAAQLLGVTKDAVKNRLLRARKKLKKIVLENKRLFL